VVHVGSEPVTRAQLPESIINYVVRTHDLVLLDDVAQPSAFSDDEYLRTSAPRALLCLPLIKYGALIGVLYLENHLTTDVFTEDRLSILKLLASQAAISLDNARLYAERQQAEMFLEEAQRLSRTGSFGWNVRTGALTWSAETYQIFGYTAETQPMIDKVFARLHPDDRERVVHRMERVAREPTEWETKHRIVMPDGTIKHVHVVARPIDNSGTRDVDYVGAVMDVTRERMAEELRRAKESAETANRAKDLFMANVSHELRTPLNAIRGMTELVLDGRITDDQRTSLATVKAAADSLAVILDDLLDFAKIEAGKLALDATELSISSLVREVVRPFAVRAEHKGLVLVCELASDVPDPLVGDVLRMRQVLTNLVGNAIKFTAAGTVGIEIGVIERATDQVTLRFAVRDTGIGIAADKQVVIFEAFEQADPSTTRRHGGTGLGLTIASRIVGLMGGTLAVESAVGRGSTFWFTATFPVPAAPPTGAQIEAAPAPADPPARPAPSPTTARRPLRVLVAEDNDLNIVLMRQLLATRGHDARFATTGLEAIAEAAEHAFDVLLLDVHLPEVDGFQVIEAIRRREHTTGERLQVIAMTARSRKEDREACLAAGMDGFLPKPIHAVDLWAALDRVGQLMQRPIRQLVDPRVLLASCGGDAATLTGIGAALAVVLPGDLASVRLAFERRDAGRLRHAAHKLVTTVSTFSTTLGLLATTLEAQARAGDLSSATASAVDELAAAGPELIREVAGLTIEGLRARQRHL
jgi:PAS domain S-box-containing protein